MSKFFLVVYYVLLLAVLLLYLVGCSTTPRGVERPPRSEWIKIELKSDRVCGSGTKAYKCD